MTRFRNFVCSIIAFQAVLVVAAERQFEIESDGFRTIATESVPDGVSAENIDGAVLLIHGWAGQMDEVGDLYKRLAKQLEQAGIASVRVNIRGESEQERTGYRLTSTFSSRVEDAQAGLDYLAATYSQARLGVVGFSLGGSTALKLVGDNPELISTLALWSSAGDPNEIFVNMLDDSQREQLARDGEIVFPAWVDLTLTSEHVAGMKGFDVFTALSSYEGSLMSVRGSEDYVPPQEQQIFAAASSEPEIFVPIDGADHIFNTLEPDSSYDEQVIALTAEWVVDQLLREETEVVNLL